MATEAGHAANRPYTAQDGSIHLNGGAFYNDAEVDVSSGMETPLAGVAAGYKIARGETALDASNPTPVVTGLTTCVSFTATLKGTAAPGDNTSVLTADISGGDVNVYAWKNTGGTDPTLVASTGTESFYWIAVGT